MRRDPFAWGPIAFPFAEKPGALAGALIQYSGVPAGTDWIRAGFDLPESLQGAAPKRLGDFLAGRIAAKRALERLGGYDATPPLGRHADGRPRWPHGVAGAISHSEGVALAVVADAARHRCIGADVQRLLDRAKCAALGPRIAPECGSFPAGWAEEELLTLAFSAKESLFKALSGDTAKVFGFDSARLLHVDRAEQRFELRLQRTLTSHWVEGTAILGRYQLLDGWMLTVLGF